MSGVDGGEQIAAQAQALGYKPDGERRGDEAPEGASYSLGAGTGVGRRQNHHATQDQLHEIRQSRARRRRPEHGYGGGMHQQQNRGYGQYGAFTAQC